VFDDVMAGVDKESEPLEYTSSIAVLPSSMPEYHRAYIARLKADEEGIVPEVNGQGDASAQSPSETLQGGLARPLQPTNRNQYSLDKAEHKPESFTPIPSKRPRQTKWQFGIRCRNPPLDAMYCIYRSLKRLGAEWEEPAMEHRPRISGPKFGDSATEDDWHGGSGQNGSKRTGGAQGTDKDANHVGQHDNNGLSAHELENAEPDPSEYDDYMPLDPWLIRCRWLKDGLTAGYGTQPGSGRSSTTHPDTPDPEHVGGSALPAATGRVYVYMEIQLYQIEPEFYLVDFKCAGYQRLLHDTVDDADDGDAAVNAKDLEARMARLDLRTPEGSAAGMRHLNKLGEKLRGRRAKNERRLSREEEKVSSPFPFLDLASKLIAALAEGE
jgi:carbon catabolite-derepressing protein kinase